MAEVTQSRDNKFHMSLYSPKSGTKVQRTQVFENPLAFTFHGPHFEILGSPQAVHKVLQGLTQAHGLHSESPMSSH